MRSFHPAISIHRIPILTFLLILSLKTYGQGEFLHKGQSGVGIDAFYAEGKRNLSAELSNIIYQNKVDIAGPGGRLGFSFNGVADLQFGIQSVKMGSSNTVRGISISSRFVYHAVKQSDKFPLSVRGILSYGYSDYDDGNTTITDLGLGAGVYRRTYIRENSSFTPSIDFIYVNSTFKYPGSTIENYSESEVVMAIAIPLAFHLGMGHIIHFAPEIYYGMKTKTGNYGLSLGYIIPFYMGRN